MKLSVKKFALALVCVVAFALAAGAEEKPKIAVIDAILPAGIDSAAINPITEKVIESLVNSGLYDVLDRKNIASVLKEAEFQMSGIVDEASAVKAGSLLGAGAVVIIKVDKLDGTFYLTVKMIEVSSAKIVAQASESQETPKVTALVEMAGSAVAKLIGAPADSGAVAVGVGKAKPGEGKAKPGDGMPGRPGAPALRIGFFTPPVDPMSPAYENWAWKGLENFAEIRGLAIGKDVERIVVEDPANFERRLEEYAATNPVLIVCPGFLWADAVRNVAPRHPGVKFGLIDSVVEAPNVRSVVFQEKDGAFLAGVAAGLKAKRDAKKAVGFVGGSDMPVIRKFQAGYLQGVKAAYPECKVLVDFAKAFDDPGAGKALAKKQYDSGAYVVFHAAGKSGDGVFAEAIERRKRGDVRWVIGVDIDQFGLGMWTPGQSVTLTSCVKRVDAASHMLARTCDAPMELWGKVVLLGVNEGGVGLPYENPNIPPEMADRIAAFERDIYEGRLKVKDGP